MKTFEKASLITQDSRKVKPGAVFFAVEGKIDGHDFVPEVLAMGAAAVVIRKGHPKEKELAKDPRVVAVPNTRMALAEAACAFYGNPSHAMPVFGVTGTNGKTTSTYLLEALLRGAGENPAVIGTVENRLGKERLPSTHTTPDCVSLQQLLSSFLKKGATATVMEVTSHALDQYRTWGMRFEAALFTNLTQDHLDYHGTFENYFQAKTRLFIEYPVKVRAIHTDDPYGEKLAEICEKRGFEVIRFGKSEQAVNYKNLAVTATGIRGTIAGIKIDTPLLGAFNAQNLAGAIAVGIGIGLSKDAISKAFSAKHEHHLVPGRMEPVPNKNGLTIVVDYAHTPDALENALKTLRPLCEKELVCVFGCGGDRDATKRPLMGAIAENLADRIFVTSDNPRTEDPMKILTDILGGLKKPQAAKVISDRREAIHTAVKSLKPGDILLIAGKGHEDYQILGTTKVPFDDRKVALENL